jgi:hypothetical protein
VITVKQPDGSPVDITGATFTGVLHDVRSNAPKKTLTSGNFAITDAGNGKFTYTPVADDVNTPGTWLLETVITISSQPRKVQTKPFEILPAFGS